MISEQKEIPCIYLDLKNCGKKIDFFYFEEKKMLTNKSSFENLVLRKMNEWKIEKKYHPVIVDSLEIFLPMFFLIAFGVLAFPKE